MKRHGLDLILIPFILIGVLIISLYTINYYNRKNQSYYGPVSIVNYIDKVVSVEDNYSLINKDDMYGVISSSGEEVIPFEYNNINSMVVLNKYIILYQYVNNKSRSLIFTLDGKYLSNYGTYLNIINDSVTGKTYFSYDNKNKTVIMNDEFMDITTIPLYENIDIINNYIFILRKDNYKSEYYDLNGKKISNYSNYYKLGNYLVIEGKDITLINFSNDGEVKYDSLEIQANNFIFKKKNDYFGLTNKGEVLELDKNGLVINKNYKLDKCSQGGYTLTDKGGNRIYNDCADYFDFSHLDFDIIVGVLYKDNDNRTCNGTECGNYSYGIVSLKNHHITYSNDYIINDDYLFIKTDGVKVYDHSLVEVKLPDTCNYISEVNKDLYICTNNYMEYALDNKLNKIYEGEYIICNDEGLCINREYNSSLSSVYLGNKLLLPADSYYSIALEHNNLIIKKFYNTSVINFAKKNSNDFINIKINNLNTDIDVDEIIDEYQLDDIEDIIYENIELFKEYASVVLNNKNISNYYGHVLYLFKYIADNKQYMDIEYLLNNLTDLKIIKDPLLKNRGNDGEYNNDSKMISINSDEERVLYHELIHFVDYNSKQESYVYYQCDNTIYDRKTLKSKKINDCDSIISIRDMTFIREGMAENETAAYFNKGNVITYKESALIMTILEYIYGVDKINYLFFNNNEGYDLYNMLVVKGNLTIKEYLDFIDLANDLKNANTKLLIIDYLNRIYNKVLDSNWESDKLYCAMIKALLKNVDLSNVSYKDILNSINMDIIVEELDNSYILGDYHFIYKDDKLYTVIYMYDPDKFKIDRNYLVSYDYNKNILLESMLIN